MLHDFAKKIPGLKPVYRLCRKSIHSLMANYKIAELKKNQVQQFVGNPETNLIVSLTSFPARINTVWITIETLFRQEYKPWKIVLVLSLEEFPDKKLPKELSQQIERGLEILWTEKNTRSYKKLLPVRETYPEAIIVTVDDDIIYEPWRLTNLVESSKRYPKAVIGHRGRVVKLNKSRFESYMTWPLADQNTSGKVLLTGVGGILYPPYLLDEEILLDIKMALALCPTADDVWFWTTSLKSGVPSICLGDHHMFPIEYDNSGPALMTCNCAGGQNDVQLKNVIDYFGLWEFLNNDC